MTAEKSFFSYRNLVYFATAITGFSALCGQVVWQKYLTILVGSEARSMSLVVAVFLFGLALGYWFFGKLTEKPRPRFRLLKIYGYIEWATAVYLLVFHFYYELLKIQSFHSPANIIFDLLIACSALFLPTFLMGASIPLLTAIIPDSSQEINRIHSRIYGWNTVGAFIGVLTAGFYLIPSFGFALTLIIAGGLNFFAALVFVGNRLKGETLKREPAPSLPTALSNRFFMIFVFFTGAVIISLEILFVRLLNVSIGAGVYNFPLILSLFVGGMGLGSLSLSSKASSGYLLRQIILSVFFLGTVYATAPYWSIWLNHIRVTLTSIPFNWYLFKLEIWIFLGVFIFPTAFFMGRLLPLSYSFLKKTKDNYGAVCGYLYFFNTLGTVFGAVVIGYLAFYFFNLNSLFKINLVALIVFIGYIAFREKKKFAGVCALALMVALFFLPQWNRRGHNFGYFRNRVPATYHFQKLFYLPVNSTGKVSFLRDGPNSTVSILNFELEKDKLDTVQKIEPKITGSYSVIVNGKSDGNFLNDLSTMVLLSSLGYLFAPEKPALSTAVIGLGTGVSAGILGKIKDVKEVVVLEISHAVISALKSLPFYSFDVMSNPKIQIIERDAFRHFMRTDKKFDLIVSEPPNPWVAGVENLFSREFYRLAREKLNKGGVLSQWLHVYSMDSKTFRMICNTVRREFPFTELYRVGTGDVVILAGTSPFQYGKTMRERFFRPALASLHKSFGLLVPEDLHLIRILESERYTEAVFKGFGVHTLTEPQLAYRADKAFFLGNSLSLFDILPGPLPYLSSEMEETRTRQFKKYLKTPPEKITEPCLLSAGFRFFCAHIKAAVEEHQIYRNSSAPIPIQFAAYGRLRVLGLVPYDRKLLQKTKEWIIREKIDDISLIMGYIHQVFSVEGHAKVLSGVRDFPLSEKGKKRLIKYIQQLSLSGLSSPETGLSVAPI